MLKPTIRSIFATFAVLAVGSCTQSLADDQAVEADDNDVEDEQALNLRCAPMAGGIIEEDSGCVTLGGPTRSLRSESGGSGGAHVSTGTTTRANRVNFARYDVNVTTPGRYTVSAYITAGTATTAAYEITHAGQTETVTLSQAGVDGFVVLGSFQFSRGAGQKILVSDNTGISGQRLVFDGVRIDPERNPVPPPPTTVCARVQTTTAVNVRSTASTTTEPLGTLAQGVTVERLATTQGQAIQGSTQWFKVPLGNQQGYIAGAYAHCVDVPVTPPTDQMQAALTNAGVSPVVAERAIFAYRKALQQDLTDSAVFTVIDFSQPSTAKRMWSVNLNTGVVLVNERVAHGAGSGSASNPAMASSFSNTDGSHQSSLGLARTAETFQGSHGYSLRLDGLEPQNDAVRARAIILHGADYVEDSFISGNGYAGRSWGCPAVALSKSRRIIDVVKHGTLIFSYFPNANWLATSPFLH